MNEKNFAALQYNGPNTNLRVGLADEHEWMGGASKAQNGIICNPNIPSEEVFTTPHAYKVDGTVSSTKPLSYQGTLIDDIKVTFKTSGDFSFLIVKIFLKRLSDKSFIFLSLLSFLLPLMLLILIIILLLFLLTENLLRTEMLVLLWEILLIL